MREPGLTATAGLESLRELLQTFSVSRGQWLLCPGVAWMERQGTVVGQEPGSGVRLPRLAFPSPAWPLSVSLSVKCGK